MKWAAYIFIALSIVLSSCEKLEEPDLTSNDVQFFIDGELGNSPIVIEAGNDSAYMHTSFGMDSLNIFEFKGTLGHQACESSINCKGSLSIILRDGKVSNGGSNSGIDSTLTLGVVPFRSPIDSTLSGFEVQFKDESFNKNGLLYSWDFGDGNTSIERSPKHIYSATSPSQVTACLTVTDQQTGSVSTICNQIYLPTNCKADFTYQFIGSSLNALNALEQGTGPYQYLWNFGNGYLPLASQSLPDFSVIDSLTVCIKIIDAVGCESTMCNPMIVSTSNIDCASEFNWNVSPIWTYNALDFNEVIITYTDENGMIWSSDRYKQDNALFEVIDIYDYAVNRNGESTKAIEFTGFCKLYGNSSTDYILFNNINGKMAVAHPN